MEQKYKVNEGNKENIRRTVERMLWKQSNEYGEDDLDNKLYKRILKDNYTEQQIEEFSEAMRIAYEQSFKTKRPQEHQANTNQSPGGLKNLQQ
jgi:uncharacterized HAD superfamily protein